MATLNLTKMTVSGTPGTGNITCGAAVAPYVTFAAGGAIDGAQYSFVIAENAKFMCFHGTVTIAGGVTTIARDEIFDSSAGYGVNESFGSNAQIYSAQLRQDTVTVGLQQTFLDAGSFRSRTTAGSLAGNLETATYKDNYGYLAFDSSTQQYAQLKWRMPKSWDRGQVWFAPLWSHPATTVNYNTRWSFQGVAIRNGVALDIAMGTEQVVDDTGGATDTYYVGDKSPGVTFGNTPQSMDTILMQISRKTSGVTGNMAVPAYFYGMTFWYNTEKENDN